MKRVMTGIAVLGCSLAATLGAAGVASAATTTVGTSAATAAAPAGSTSWEWFDTFDQGVSGWGACAVEGQSMVNSGRGLAYECLQAGGPWYAPIVELWVDVPSGV